MLRLLPAMVLLVAVALTPSFMATPAAATHCQPDDLCDPQPLDPLADGERALCSILLVQKVGGLVGLCR